MRPNYLRLPEEPEMQPMGHREMRAVEAEKSKSEGGKLVASALVELLRKLGVPAEGITDMTSPAARAAYASISDLLATALEMDVADGIPSLVVGEEESTISAGAIKTVLKNRPLMAWLMAADDSPEEEPMEEPVEEPEEELSAVKARLAASFARGGAR